MLRPWVGHAQGSLSGVVRDSITRQPLAFASVFLANTTLGATTTEQGAFVFPSVPAGTYEIAGSYVGYRLAKQKVVVGAAPQQVVLALGPIANRLGEVVVRPNPNRAADYQKFLELFVGRTTFSQQCRITNPDDIFVEFDPVKAVLNASSYKFVQVENQALGYRIKYFGLRFSCDFSKNVVAFYGAPLFEEMKPRNQSQQLLWEANRAKAYRGSLTHFLKSVHDDQVMAEGFVAQRQRVVPNYVITRTDSLRRALVRTKRSRALTATEKDSLASWTKRPKAFSQLYSATPQPIDSLRRVSADKAHVFLRSTYKLRVSYLRESPDALYRVAKVQSAGPTEVPLTRRQASLLVPMKREIEIQPNGHLVNPLAVFVDEYWGFEKIGEFLPVNYLPPASAPGPTSSHL